MCAILIHTSVTKEKEVFFHISVKQAELLDRGLREVVRGLAIELHHCHGEDPGYIREETERCNEMLYRLSFIIGAGVEPRV